MTNSQFHENPYMYLPVEEPPYDENYDRYDDTALAMEEIKQDFVYDETYDNDEDDFFDEYYIIHSLQ